MLRPNPPQAFIVLLIAGILIWGALQSRESRAPDGNRAPAPSTLDGAATILEAFKARRSDVQVTAGGTVVLLMNDDTVGTPHQHFLVRLHGSEHTVKMAHNLDLAERVPVQIGDEVSFSGRYEFNLRGGVVHWTHHDPRGGPRAGYIEHRGQRYR